VTELAKEALAAMAKGQISASKAKKAPASKNTKTTSLLRKRSGSDDDEDEDMEEEMALSSHRRGRNQQVEEDSDDSDAPEEVQTSAEELARLRAAFEQHYGSADDTVKAAKKLKGPSAKRQKMKAAVAAGFKVGEQDVLDPGVLASLDGKQLTRGIEIMGRAEEDSSHMAEVYKGEKGLTIDKNARGSVRIVEGNMEVHVLSSKQDKLASFVPSKGEGGKAAANPLAALLEPRHRVNLASLVASKAKGASRTFARRAAGVDDMPAVAINYGGKGSNPRKKGTSKLLKKFKATVGANGATTAGKRK